MACLLKRREPGSAGIIVFTHNEALRWRDRSLNRIRRFLHDSKVSGEWLFGIHIQGDCSWLEEWPRENWQSFFLWPESDAPHLRNIKESQILMNCIHFMPKMRRGTVDTRDWDLCIISRPSPQKRLGASLKLIKEIFKRRSDSRFVFIVPDPRDLRLGEKCYEKQGIDADYYHLPRQLFSVRELNRISFLSTPMADFGRFPLDSLLINDIVRKSKFVLSTSHSEGTPRIVLEALLSSTPCILSKNLKTGLDSLVPKQYVLRIDDDEVTASGQVMNALEKYDQWIPDVDALERQFTEGHNVPIFKKKLENLLLKYGFQNQGTWHLQELHRRLCGHGWKMDMQYLNREDDFFEWLKFVEKNDPCDEDGLSETTNQTLSAKQIQPWKSLLKSFRIFLPNNHES